MNEGRGLGTRTPGLDSELDAESLARGTFFAWSFSFVDNKKIV